MAKHLLFVLHGMGRHPAGWARSADGPVTALKAAASRYAFFNEHDLEDLVEFVELEYDTVFERWRTQVAASAASVVAAAPDGWGRDILTGLAALTPVPGSPFAMTHPLDVALYRLLPNVHNEVIAHLHAQIVPRLRAAGGARVSLLTHSLGSAVAHDAWAALTTDKTPDNNPWHCNNPNPKRFQLRNYIVLANVSRVLQTSPKVLDLGDAASAMLGTPMRPGTAAQRPCFVRRFINAVHGLDPFPSVKRFNPNPGWRNDSYIEIPVHHFLAPNVHGYDHYLRHPKVHAAILNALLFQPQITEGEIVQELDTSLRIAQEAAMRDTGLGLTARISFLSDLAQRLAPMVEDVETPLGVQTLVKTAQEYFHA